MRALREIEYEQMKKSIALDNIKIDTKNMSKDEEFAISKKIQKQQDKEYHKYLFIKGIRKAMEKNVNK